MSSGFSESADKHGIPRADAVWAIYHAEAITEREGRAEGEVVRIYIGHPHAQALPDDYLEVMVSFRPGRPPKVFHVMRLSDLYRHLLYNEE